MKIDLFCVANVPLIAVTGFAFGVPFLLILTMIVFNIVSFNYHVRR